MAESGVCHIACVVSATMEYEDILFRHTHTIYISTNAENGSLTVSLKIWFHFDQATRWRILYCHISLVRAEYNIIIYSLELE